jgi:hypothetical protein
MRHVANRILAAIFAICLVGLFKCLSPAQEGKSIKPSSALAEAANEGYKSALAAFGDGHVTCEDVYRWSRRIMDAELANGRGNSAVANHLDRMKALNNLVMAKWKQSAANISKLDVDATNFFVLEAEANPAR